MVLISAPSQAPLPTPPPQNYLFYAVLRNILATSSDGKARSCCVLDFFPWRYTTLMGVYFAALYRALASSRTRLLDHTQRRATVGRNPLNEWAVRRRDLYLTKHNTQNRQTSIPWVGFEPKIAAGERA